MIHDKLSEHADREDRLQSLIRSVALDGYSEAGENRDVWIQLSKSTMQMQAKLRASRFWLEALYHANMVYTAAPTRPVGCYSDGEAVHDGPSGARPMDDDGSAHDPKPEKDAQRVSAAELALRQALLAGLDGDAAAYHRFLSGLTGYIRAYLRRRLPRCPDEVEDILQETLLAVHNARHTYHRDQPLTAWVHAISRYKLMDFFRHHARREALHQEVDDEVLFLHAETEAADALRDVGQLLDTLPDRHRVPIQLVKLQGLSVAEAANHSGLSESAIKVGIHRGLKMLAARLRGSA